MNHRHNLSSNATIFVSICDGASRLKYDVGVRKWGFMHGNHISNWKQIIELHLLKLSAVISINSCIVCNSIHKPIKNHSICLLWLWLGCQCKKLDALNKEIQIIATLVISNLTKRQEMIWKQSNLKSSLPECICFFDLVTMFL